MDFTSDNQNERHFFKEKQRKQSIHDALELCGRSADYFSFSYSAAHPLRLSYFKTLVDSEYVHRDVLPYLAHESFSCLEDIKKALPIEDITLTDDAAAIQQALMKGAIVVQQDGNEAHCALIHGLAREEGRSINTPETEFSVVGPKEAFVESVDINIRLIRKRLPIPELQVRELQVGERSKTRVAILHVEGIADIENVNTVIQRIQEISYDIIPDSSFITQMIEDNRNSPFPQLVDTERPDRVASVLSEGKVAILVDGSPQALTGPTTLVEFFSAFEDYFLTWYLASAFRLIRLFSVFFSVLSTPLYVAILTYHYEMIPDDLINALIASRSGIPFPPIIETIVLELAIELLREAGARLPTKVGQTIGIVGGIVIGTAAVQAGLTSNVLLIIVALAALASFTTPVYQMSNTIRLIRFPFLLAAQAYGLLGISICFAFILSHLLRMTSLGRPYVSPIYPLRTRDLKDALIRLPFSKQAGRPIMTRTHNRLRFQPDRKQSEEKQDIED
ncbi:spore germination protein [Ectobacillus ponti]|uniref:Spore germination protein n=1 Tax=Ectobacillus ponti TaxID=2961894 RepID=A0AA42BP96_9BACI|nr:spore germination protein [Ectobacillus ponti]MCP8968186.1 spore germination protein [Ectobacillus ponti]